MVYVSVGEMDRRMKLATLPLKRVVGLARTHMLHEVGVRGVGRVVLGLRLLCNTRIRQLGREKKKPKRSVTVLYEVIS